MTISGPDALRSMDEALREIRREEDDIARKLARSAELVARIRETEIGLLRQLAKVRLDPAMQAEISGRLSTAESQARAKLAEHQQALAAAEKQLRSHDQALAALAAQRAELVTTAEGHNKDLDALAATVAAELIHKKDYIELREAAEQLAHVADESLTKTRQAEADRDDKGKPYRDDSMFMYLWDRRYGTRDYRANLLVTALDGWVARLVSYPEARPNFAMLNEIPLRLREHAERQRNKAEAALARLESHEQEAIDAAGGKPIREALETAEKRIAEIDAEIVAAEDARDDAARAHQELAQGSDPAHAAAVAALAEALGRLDVQTLLAKARDTHTPEDDDIVRQIDDARRRAQEEEDETRDQRARLKTLAERRRELEDIQYEFRKQGFDKPRSVFKEDRLAGDMLNDFLRGSVPAADYWDQWQRSQSWQAEERGGFDWPDSSFAGGASRKRPPGMASRIGRGAAIGIGAAVLGSMLGGRGGARSGGRSAGPTGAFSRPRTGSIGTRKSGGFKTGGGF